MAGPEHDDPAICPECGGPRVQTDKYTGNGRDQREYTCEACGRAEILDQGPALWQVMSQANAASRAQAAPARPVSVWESFKARLRALLG